MNKKPENPRHSIQIAEEMLSTAINGRVDISAILLQQIIALARAWAYGRSIDDIIIGVQGAQDNASQKIFRWPFIKRRQA